jgi:hypothetical protein
MSNFLTFPHRQNLPLKNMCSDYHRDKKNQGWVAEGEERAKLPSPGKSKNSIMPLKIISALSLKNSNTNFKFIHYKFHAYYQ